MSYYGWKPYVSVAERQKKAEKAAAKAKKAGADWSPIASCRGAIAKTFWGKAWCENLEHYSDYANRLPRGRTYVRNGSVIDLKITAGQVRAQVMGSSLYKVAVTVTTVPAKQWQAISSDCSSSIDSLVELLQGKLSRAVMERICKPGTGLFPAPKEIQFDCSCPDWASMCKHVAAVLYGVGARLDEQPELIFSLRRVDAKDLVSQAGASLPKAGKRPAAGKVLDDALLADVFGIEMADAPPPATKVAPELLPGYGVRVPAFVISPWVKSGSVFGRDGLVHSGGGGDVLNPASTATTEATPQTTPAAVSPVPALHFDHTSILKTIARRFMSKNPPYMGARYSAAHDLSEVLGNEPRPSQFLPFIPYNLTWAGVNLTVQGASTAAGAPLVVNAPDKGPDQEFRFEDAGDGFFFIRTLTGTLYVTVDVPLGANTGPGTTLKLKQDLKYPVGAATPHNRDFQRWKLTAGGVTVLGLNVFSASCAAFPQKLLQPLAHVVNPGTVVVIGDPTPVHLPTQVPDPWRVSSPLLGAGGVVGLKP